jgi:PDDEXK-like domain of unknown function (DUF3799)
MTDVGSRWVGDELVDGLAGAEYHAVEAMSQSGATKILQSPQHYLLARTKKSEPTAAMEFGTVVHAMILEPGKVSTVVVAAPDVDKRTKAGKEAWQELAAEHAGKIVMSVGELARAQRCASAVTSHPAAARLLRGAMVERSMFWQDGKYGVPCKARIDLTTMGGACDVKTTKDASPEEFGRSCATFGYHRQEAHYRAGWDHVVGEALRFFVFVVVESDEPHAVACYTLPVEAVMFGGGQMDAALERYRDALASGRWKGYPETIDVVPFPRWAMKHNI